MSQQLADLPGSGEIHFQQLPLIGKPMPEASTLTGNKINVQHLTKEDIEQDELLTQLAQCISSEFKHYWGGEEPESERTEKYQADWMEGVTVCTNHECNSCPDSALITENLNSFDIVANYFGDGCETCPSCSSTTEEFWSVNRTERYLKEMLEEDGDIYLMNDTENNFLGWIFIYQTPAEEKFKKSFIYNYEKNIYVPVLSKKDEEFPNLIYVDTVGRSVALDKSREMKSKEAREQYKLMNFVLFPYIINQQVEKANRRGQINNALAARTSESSQILQRTMTHNGFSRLEAQLPDGTKVDHLFGAPDRTYWINPLENAAHVLHIDFDRNRLGMTPDKEFIHIGN